MLRCSIKCLFVGCFPTMSLSLGIQVRVHGNCSFSLPSNRSSSESPPRFCDLKGFWTSLSQCKSTIYKGWIAASHVDLVFCTWELESLLSAFFFYLFLHGGESWLFFPPDDSIFGGWVRVCWAFVCFYKLSYPESWPSLEMDFLSFVKERKRK